MEQYSDKMSAVSEFMWLKGLAWAIWLLYVCGQ